MFRVRVEAAKPEDWDLGTQMRLNHAGPRTVAS
jgi:hypothetical protein